MKNFQEFKLNNTNHIVGGKGKPEWAGKPDMTDWATTTVIDEDGEEELEHIAPWEDLEGGRRQYMLDLAAVEG